MKILIKGAVEFIGYNLSKFILNYKKNEVIDVDCESDYYYVSLKKKSSRFEEK